jgi:probable F420-dependent oxidoreductase
VTIPTRYGITIPFPGPLHTHEAKLHELADLGYTDVWSAETDGADGLTPLVLAAAWEPRLRLGTAILPAYTRSPALLAQSVASLADAAPGRVAIGIGSSSNVIVEKWNGLTFDRPYQRVRDTVRFLRAALSGEKVSETYSTFHVDGFRLAIRPEVPPSLLIAGLREGMLGLAGRDADGVIINWLTADDVTRVVGVVRDAAGGAEREVVCRLFCCPSEDIDAVRIGARRAIAAYLNVPVYRDFHRWLGRDAELGGMWSAWEAGDRKAALAAIPDDLVDRLIVHGSPEACRARIQEYFDRGVTTVTLALQPLAPFDFGQAVRDLAPH